MCEPCRLLVGPHPPRSADACGFGRRAGGRLLDMVWGQGIGLVAGIVAAIALVILEQVGLARSGWLGRLDPGFGFNLLSGVTSSVLGAACTGWISGASMGKLLMGMRIVSVDGRRAGLVANLQRELAYLLDAMFFGIVALKTMEDSPLQQRIGDQWARTVVVRSGSLRAPVAFSAGRIALGIAFGFGVQVAVMAAFVVALGR